MTKQKNNKLANIELIFKNVCVQCELNSDVFSETDRIKIRKILLDITKEIYIDKSYVAFKGSKFKKTFMTETGWNALCNLIIESNYCKNVSAFEAETLKDVYTQIIIEYITQFFNDIGYDVSNMYFDVKPNTKFIVEYHSNQSTYWKTYCGEWQSWHKLKTMKSKSK